MQLVAEDVPPEVVAVGALVDLAGLLRVEAHEQVQGTVVGRAGQPLVGVGHVQVLVHARRDRVEGGVQTDSDAESVLKRESIPGRPELRGVELRVADRGAGNNDELGRGHAARSAQLGAAVAEHVQDLVRRPLVELRPGEDFGALHVQHAAAGESGGVDLVRVLVVGRQRDSLPCVVVTCANFEVVKPHQSESIIP